MTGTAPRFPAEWERQSAILIAWPHAETDWAERLGEVEETYIALVVAITRFQPVLVCVASDDVEAYARARLASARVDMGRGRFIGTFSVVLVAALSRRRRSHRSSSRLSDGLWQCVRSRAPAHGSGSPAAA